MEDNLHRLTGKTGVMKVLPFSLQQVLAMFVTNMVPIFLIGGAARPELSTGEIMMLIQNAMFAAGIATIIQATPVWKIGSGLPIFMGISFTFIVPLSAVAAKYGYGAVMGCVIAGGLFEGLLGLTVRYWKKIMAPIVSALVVTGIGISLLSTAARSFGGGYAEDFGSIENVAIGVVTLVSSVAWMLVTKGFIKQLSILIGVLAGYLTALLLGRIDFSGMKDCAVFALPKIMPYTPVFRLDAIASICIIYLVSATETIGDATAIAGGALHRELTQEETTGALTVDGFGSLLSGVFGGTPVTSYSENIGLTILTGVVNRNVARVGGAILVLCGLFPPIAKFVDTIPKPVIGGILILVLGQILISGMEMIAEAGFTNRNKLIASISLSVAIGFTASTEAGIWDSFPTAVQTIFAQNVVAVIFALSIILNLVLPKNLGQKQ